MKNLIRIYWTNKTRDPAYKGYQERIRNKFGIQQGETLNGESFVELEDSLLDDLRETERLGFIHIRSIKK
jgi:hypothetical protein